MSISQDFKLILVRHLWGTSGQWEELFPRFKAAGFSAVEDHVPPAAERPRWLRLCREYDFGFIAQIFTQGNSIAEHVESFRHQVGEAAAMEPLIINAHSGRDAWTETEAMQFFEAALAIETAAGVKVAHETHRGRILFNPWITGRILERLNQLRLCCDFSHWVCVAERLLDDQLPLLQKAAERCFHLHARVGYEQGPQVPDPRAPEYAIHLAAHEAWWRMIWQAQAKRGDAITTLTPEFGPPAYLHTLPHTNAPVADLWDICHWQARRQADNFNRWRRESDHLP
jgi:hypothetical protein